MVQNMCKPTEYPPKSKRPRFIFFYILLMIFISVTLVTIVCNNPRIIPPVEKAQR